MPLETATYISDLNTSNPAHSDGLNQSDAHARLIKAVLKTTLPNITGAVTATQTQLNAAAGWTTAGANLLAHGGTFFDNGAGAASTDGFLNTLAGDIDVQLQGNLAATFQRTGGANFFKVNGSIQTTGAITATGLISGPGVTPIGGTIIWWDDTLPADGMWTWANGQVIASANTVCPILLARWGNKFGGNGTTTMGVPDLRETVPIGKNTMGGAAARGNYASPYTPTTLNAVVGEAAHVLTTGELASHYHSAAIYDPTHVHGVTGGVYGGTTTIARAQSTVADAFSPLGTAAVAIAAAATGVRVNSSNGLDTTYSAGSGTAHNNQQLSTVCNWIIRLG